MSENRLLAKQESKLKDLPPLPPGKVYVLNQGGAVHDVPKRMLRAIMAKYPTLQVLDADAVPEEIGDLCKAFNKEELFTFVTQELGIEDLPQTTRKENLAAMIVDHKAYDELMSRAI